MSYAPRNMSEFFTDDTLAKWNKLMPGTVSGRSPRCLGGSANFLIAGTGYGPPNQIFFTTSMAHQLHCVVSLIHSKLPFQTLIVRQYMMARIYSGVMSHITHTLPDDYHTHFLHCIDYLRQGIMCSADLALEAHDATDSDDLGPLDGGWSGHHGETTSSFSLSENCALHRDADHFLVCKDYSQVISYLEGKQVYDSQLIYRLTC
jgi:hypothetical protein